VENCKYEGIIKIMQEDIKEIKGDVKSLLRLKWQFLGGSAAIGFLFYIFFAIMSLK